MSYQAGSAQVSVTPDMTTFQSKVKEGLTEAEPQFTQFGDDAGKAFAGSFQDQLKASFADLPTATVKATADTTKLDADLDAAAKGRTATVKADADTVEASAKLDAAAKTRTVSLKAVADTSAVSKVNDVLSPLVLGAAGLATALGPTAAAAALAVGGIGVAFGAAAATAGAFGAVAVPMFTAVTTAQKSLTTAQAAYDKATTPAQRTAALAAEQAALAKLTPSEKDLLTQLTALEGEYKKLTTAQQPFVEAAITPWLATATSGMKLLTPLIDDGASAIQLLGTKADAAIKSPFWTTFANTLGATGQDALIAFGTAAGSIGDGLAHLFVTFAPDIDKLLADIPTLAGYFDTWAKSVTSGGLESFFATTFSHANLQALSGDLKNLGSFLGSAATASSQMSGTAFAGLTNVLDVLGRLTPTEIEAVTALFLAIKGISAVSSAVNAVSSFLSNAQKAAGKVAGLFGTDADATAQGAATGKAAGTAASAAWKSSFDPWAASTAEAGAEAAGEAAGVSFTAAFTAAVEAGMPKAMLAIEAGDAVEAKALGAGLGVEAGASFGSTVGETEGGKPIVAGAVVKDGEEGAAKETAGSKASKAAGSASGLLSNLGVIATAASLIQGASTASSAFVSKPGTSQGKAATDIKHAQTQVTGIPSGGGTGSPSDIAAGFAGWASVDVPKIWSGIYQGFETEVGSPVAAWFTNSLPHLFTAQIPMGWDAAYQNFENGFGSPVAAWFTNSLPHFFTAGIPADVWSPVYQGFERDIGSPIASWFTTTLPGIFSGAGTVLQTAGHDISGGLATGWNATQGALSTAFGAAKTWVTGSVSTAGSWLQGAGGEVSSGFRTAWTATSGAVGTAFGAAKTWVANQFTSAASWLSAAGGSVSAGFSKAWNATSGTVTADFAKGKSWVTSAFSGAESWLVSAGKNVVIGLYNGLISDGSLITSAASYLANLIPSTVKSLLGINSPAKVMIPFGSAVPEGLALGMNNGASFVTDAGSRLVDTTVASLSGLAASQSLAALSVPSITSGARLPGVTSPLGTGPLQLQLSYVGSGNAVTDAVIGGLQGHIQGQYGGDVQAALGRGPVRTS